MMLSVSILFVQEVQSLKASKEERAQKVTDAVQTDGCLVPKADCEVQTSGNDDELLLQLESSQHEVNLLKSSIHRICLDNAALGSMYKDRRGQLIKASEICHALEDQMKRLAEELKATKTDKKALQVEVQSLKASKEERAQKVTDAVQTDGCLVPKADCEVQTSGNDDELLLQLESSQHEVNLLKSSIHRICLDNAALGSMYKERRGQLTKASEICHALEDQMKRLAEELKAAKTDKEALQVEVQSLKASKEERAQKPSEHSRQALSGLEVGLIKNNYIH
ncbi:hypothetical protein V5799_020588 [Amblyomma americanum]|uniref:Uncharacterized protein n=1 Tax=Amblyomma americanum TaxID=6943 RepID=A0AAQ4ETJ4_AMBAM